MRGILTLRGSNQTTVKDIVDLRKFTAEEFSQLHDVLRELCVFLMGQGQGRMKCLIHESLVGWIASCQTVLRRQ